MTWKIDDPLSYINAYGYRVVYVGKRRWRGEHVLVAERALGKPLPAGAIVHHVNEDRLDNRPANLVICPSRAYHNLLHRRMDALRESGHVDWHRCEYCKKHGPPDEMRSRRRARYGWFHAECARRYNNQRYRRRTHVAA